MHTIITLYMESGRLEWSYSFAVEIAGCVIRIYYMIMLYKINVLLTGYDITRTLQEQLSTHKKQEQRY